MTRIVAAVGLIMLPRWQRDTRFWTVLTVLSVAGTLRAPFLDLDNHHVLQLYWLVALTLATVSEDPDEVLRRTARWLAGVIFLFATVWKLLTPDFADGAVIAYVISVSETGSGTGSVAGLHAPGTQEANDAVLRDAWSDALLDPELVVPASTPLHIGDGTQRMAAPMAVATLALEGAVAIAFLAPLRGRWRLLRDATLLGFVAATYLLLPVLVFGGILVSLGIASSSLHERSSLLLYIAGFLGVALGAAVLHHVGM